MNDFLRRSFVLGTLLLCVLAPTRFPDPVILHPWIWAPKDLGSWIFGSWPNGFFASLVSFNLLLGVFSAEFRKIPRHGLLLPLVFLGIQSLSSFLSVNFGLSCWVLFHFILLGIAFVMGTTFDLISPPGRTMVWGWILASIIVVWNGFSQATGGLEELRQYFLEHPEWSQQHPELWRKLQSDRIFSTFVYPNALGGYAIMAVFMAALLPFLFSNRLERLVTGTLSAIVIVGLLYCLGNSQSKGSYLALAVTACCGSVLMVRQLKYSVFVLSGCILLFALGWVWGFGKEAVEKGKRSGSARVGYWQAALTIGARHPFLGTGPGTFLEVYPEVQKQTDESTKLVHNNYLQMWSDSGILGTFAFALWIFLPLGRWFQASLTRSDAQRIPRILLGCSFLTFALHSLVDFDLYLLSNSWPAFLLLGMLFRASTTFPSSSS